MNDPLLRGMNQFWDIVWHVSLYVILAVVIFILIVIAGRGSLLGGLFLVGVYYLVNRLLSPPRD